MELELATAIAVYASAVGVNRGGAQNNMMHRLIMAKGENLGNRDCNLTGYSTTPSEAEHVICGLESKLAKSDAVNLYGHFADR